ncbi:MAG: cyclic nucleotide-binding domain-containing protein, partial [Bdellovibrionota bacterium]
MNIGLSLKLKSSVKIELSASHIKLVDSKSSRDVTMKADKLPWIELLDGTLNLTEFLSCVAATQKSLPLHEILSFLNLLTHIGMLEGALQDLSRVYDEDEVLEENPRKTNTTLSSDAVARELSKMHFFENFSREALSCLAEKSRLAHLVPGTFIVHQDDKAEEFFALLKGQVSVYVQSDEGVSSRVCVLREGSVFGENALRQGGRRGADVFAKTEVQLLAIPSDIFSQCMQDFGDEKSRGLLNERIYLAQYLSSTPLFSNVPAEALSLFIQAGELRKMKKGEIVFRQGDAGEDFYLVVR